MNKQENEEFTAYLWGAVREAERLRYFRKLPRLMDNPNVELSGIFPPGGSNEEVKVQRVADCCRSQAG